MIAKKLSMRLVVLMLISVTSSITPRGFDESFFGNLEYLEEQCFQVVKQEDPSVCCLVEYFRGILPAMSSENISQVTKDSLPMLDTIDPKKLSNEGKKLLFFLTVHLSDAHCFALVDEMLARELVHPWVKIECYGMVVGYLVIAAFKGDVALTRYWLERGAWLYSDSDLNSEDQAFVRLHFRSETCPILDQVISQDYSRRWGDYWQGQADLGQIKKRQAFLQGLLPANAELSPVSKLAGFPHLIQAIMGEVQQPEINF